MQDSRGRRQADEVALARDGKVHFGPVDDIGVGPYILLGLLVAIGLVGGLMYFNGSPPS